MASLIDQQDYTCAVCFEIYSERKPPKLLMCGHAFCSLCLVECCRKQPFLCPVCKNPQNLTKERVPSLSTVFSLLAIAEKVKATKEQSVKVKKPLCQKHQELLESSCSDCDTNLCKICMQNDLKSGKHKDHNIVTLTESVESKTSEIKKHQDRVQKAHGRLLEQHTSKVSDFKNKIVSMKQNVNRDADQAVNEINKNRQECLYILDTVSEEVFGNLEKDLNNVHEQLDSFQEEIATFLASIAETTNVSVDIIQTKAENIEKMLDSFDSQMYLPKLNLSFGGSVKLRKVNVEPPPHAPLVLAGTAASPNVCLYHEYLTHGSFCVRGESGTTIHLCRPGDSDDMRRLLEKMRPPPDAVVWGKYWASRPQMPPTTETVDVGPGWDAAVQGVSQAEDNYRWAVAVAPAFVWDNETITLLVDHVTSRRQHSATHIIVVHHNQDWMTEWQLQLVEDERMMPLL